MIIERHMPHLCGSLPFIDHASHMRNDHFTETEVETEVEPVEETNPITSQMEEWESKLQTAKGVIQCLREGLRSLDRATILACMESIEEMSHAVVYRVGAPKPTNEEDCGSITSKAQVEQRGASVKHFQGTHRKNAKRCKSSSEAVANMCDKEDSMLALRCLDL